MHGSDAATALHPDAAVAEQRIALERAAQQSRRGTPESPSRSTASTVTVTAGGLPSAASTASGGSARTPRICRPDTSVRGGRQGSKVVSHTAQEATSAI